MTHRICRTLVFALAGAGGCALPPVVLPPAPISSSAPSHTFAVQHYTSERLDPDCRPGPRNFVDLWWSLNFPSRKQGENRRTFSFHLFHVVFAGSSGVMLPGFSVHEDFAGSLPVGVELSGGLQPGVLLYGRVLPQTSVLATLPGWITLAPYLQTGPLRFVFRAFPPGISFIWTGTTWGLLGGLHDAMEIGYTRPFVLDAPCPKPPIRETPVLTLGLWFRR